MLEACDGLRQRCFSLKSSRIQCCFFFFFFLIWVFGRKAARTTEHLLGRGAWMLSPSSSLTSRGSEGEPCFEWVLQHQFHGQRKPSPGRGAAQDLVVPSTQISMSAVGFCGSRVCSPLIGQGFMIPRPCARLSGDKCCISQMLAST